MKCISILFLSLTIAFASIAQTAGSRAARQANHNRVLSGLLQQQCSDARAALRTTSTTTLERVIRQTVFNTTTGSLSDSIRLGYGASTKGSTYDYNTMIYPYNYPYNASPMFNYAGKFATPQVLFDTFQHWTVDGNTLTYGYFETHYATYNAAYDLTGFKAFYADSSTYQNMVYANTFSTANNITAGDASNEAAGIADSAFRQYFTYNTSNLLTEDSTYELHNGVWRIASKSYYTYDGTNDLIQINNYTNDTDTSFLLPLVEQLQYINTYDGSHRLLTVAANYHYDAGLSPYTRDTFAYTGTYAFHTAWREYQYDTINSYWAPQFNMTKVLNGSGKPDTVNIEGFDSIMNAWVPQTMDVIKYDTDGNPDTLSGFQYDFTFWPATPGFVTSYYYQVYDNHLDVANITTTDNVKIFPNPATNIFSISQTAVPDNTQVTISLINAAGQFVTRETIYWNGETQLSVADLSQGVYWLIIQDATGNVTHRQTVVKL